MIWTYNVGSVALNSENDGSGNYSADNGANGPEECQAVQHHAEALAGLVSEIQSLTELSATRSVNSANVFNVCIDAGSERCALG